MVALALVPEGFDLVALLDVWNSFLEIDSSGTDRENHLQGLHAALNRGADLGVFSLVASTPPGSVEPLVTNDQRETITEENKRYGLKHRALPRSVDAGNAGPVS